LFLLTDLFLKGRLRHDLDDAEKRALDEAVSGTIEVPARTRIVARGDRLDRSYYVVEGAVLRHLDDRRGERQLVGVNIAGDFVDLHGYPMKRLDHSISTLTATTLATVPHAAITALVAAHPHLARALWFSTLLDAAMHREWIFRLGRLNAEGRIAHLICELLDRLRFVDLFDGRVLTVPLLQRDYAEACGITPVHANRSFRILKERGLLSPLGDGQLDIHDEAGLREVAQFDASYLYGEGDLAPGALDDA
jgi:CRP-like cAMP-binding protein